MKKIILFPLTLLFIVSCSNSMFDTTKLEEKVTTMEEDASKLKPKVENITIINDEQPITIQRVDDALNNRDIVEKQQQLKDNYTIFRESVDTKNIRTLQEKAETDKQTYIERKPYYEALDKRVKELEPKVNEHIEVKENPNGEREVIFKDIQDNLKHSTIYNSSGIRTNSSIYDGNKLVEESEYSSNGLYVVKKTKYNSDGSIDSITTYDSDGRETSSTRYSKGVPTGSFLTNKLNSNTIAIKSLPKVMNEQDKDGRLDSKYGFLAFFISTNAICVEDNTTQYGYKCNITTIDDKSYIPYGSAPDPVKGRGCTGVYEMFRLIGATGIVYSYSDYNEECMPTCAIIYSVDSSRDDSPKDLFDTNIDNIPCSSESKNRFIEYLKGHNVKVEE